MRCRRPFRIRVSGQASVLNELVEKRIDVSTVIKH